MPHSQDNEGHINSFCKKHFGKQDEQWTVVSNRYHRVTQFWFKSSEDATLFKLRWC